ncbi:hypothetical protein OSB04_031580 [Centaurea solstitialis]|uniref:Uncharacterized protein n=1 Tax=Centaurea solstitialis TaxID=347529 RepID=A0AA38VXQ6_9ASTR|nr:hypothetical protein OSB04_031580 [Centaurea solstitialis]
MVEVGLAVVPGGGSRRRRWFSAAAAVEVTCSPEKKNGRRIRRTVAGEVRRRRTVAGVFRRRRRRWPEFTGSETRPPVLVVGEYQQWKRRMINFLDLLDDKLMVSIIEGPIRPTVTVAEVARTDVTPHLPAYEVEKPYDMFSHEQRARAAINKCALTLLTMALPNDMFARVDSCKDARAMWLGIEQQMQGGDKALEGQKENAMNAYESFCAREGETLTETYNRLNIYVNDLRRLGLEKNKYEVNVKFLKRLNKLWQSVTISIQVSQNLGQLGLHDLYNMMLPHEEPYSIKLKRKSILLLWP